MNKIYNTLKEILFTENDYDILCQELVTTVPINLVKIEESDIILDMCAVPGNKVSHGFRNNGRKNKN